MGGELMLMGIGGCFMSNLLAAVTSRGLWKYQTCRLMHLSRVENGQANPTINALEIIANSFGMSIFGKAPARCGCS